MTDPQRDFIQRLYFGSGTIRGHWVALDGVMSELRSRRRYADPIAVRLGELLAAVTLIADGLKWRGSIALQTKLSGDVRVLHSEYRPQDTTNQETTEGLLRAIARTAPDVAPDAPDLQVTDKDLVGGHMALSLLPDPDDQYTSPYQGLIELRSGDLAANLDNYFVNSEQVPTRFALASDGQRAVGLLLQRLPDDSPMPSEIGSLETARADASWTALGGAIDDIDPAGLLQRNTPQAAAEALQLLCDRIGAGFELRLAPPRNLRFACTCTKAKTANVLATLGEADLKALFAEQPTVDVTCEFCGKTYPYTDADRVTLLASPAQGD